MHNQNGNEKRTLDPVESRQAERTGLIYVLLASGVGAIVALTVVYLSFFGA